MAPRTGAMGQACIGHAVRHKTYHRMQATTLTCPRFDSPPFAAAQVACTLAAQALGVPTVTENGPFRANGPA